MERVPDFKPASRDFPFNITGFRVYRDILLVFSFIWIVRWYLAVLGVAFEMHEIRLLSIYAEENG